MENKKYVLATGRLFQTKLSFMGCGDYIEIPTDIKRMRLRHDDEKWIIEYLDRSSENVFETVTCQYVETAITMIKAEHGLDRRA